MREDVFVRMSFVLIVEANLLEMRDVGQTHVVVEL
jgi:hypothetical protein